VRRYFSRLGMYVRLTMATNGRWSPPTRSRRAARQRRQQKGEVGELDAKREKAREGRRREGPQGKGQQQATAGDLLEDVT